MSDTIDSKNSAENLNHPSVDSNPPSAPAVAVGSASGPSYSPYAIGSIVLLILAVAYFFAQNKSLNHHESDQLLRLQAELADSARSLNRTRTDSGLSPRDVSDVEMPEQIAERLNQDAKKLTRLLQLQMEDSQEKERQIIEKNRQLAEVLKTREQSEKNAAASPTAGSSPTNLGEVAALQQQLKTSESKVIELSQALEQRPTREELTLSMARVKSLETELAQLRRELFLSKPLALMALRDEELLEPARELLKEIRALEGKSDRDLSDAYNRFASTKRATFVREISFKSGVTELSVEDQEALKKVLQAAPDQAYFFIAGYTAPTSDVKVPAVSPSTLPQVSQRTINIAQFLKSQIKGQQQVQAAVVGSTMRFSSTDLERNQVCEIWQLSPSL